MNRLRSSHLPHASRAPDRLLRITELIRRELLTLLHTRVRDPRVHHVVITRVHVFSDLSVAKVYIVLDDDKQDLQELLTGLRHAAGFLRSCLGRRLNLRRTPKLFFMDAQE